MKFSNNKKNYSPEMGAALVTSILAFLLATLLGFALVTIGLSTWEISSNGVEQTEAFYIAESGLTHATALINKVPKNQFSAVLTNGANSTPDTGDELSSPPTTGLWTTTDNIPAGNNAGGGVTFGKGRYYVSVRNDTATGETPITDSNGILIITSTGVGRDGATATLEAVVKLTVVALPGLLANGDVKFTSELKVLGPNGLVQINGDAKFTGTGKNACVEKEFQIMTPSIPWPSESKVGPLCTDTPVEGTTLLFNQPRAIPPIIDVPRLQSEFRPSADWIFRDNGEIYPQTNGVVRSLSLSDFEKTTLGLHEWKYKIIEGQWSHTIDTRLPDGNYYFENTNASMSKGGDSINPPKVTIFSEGHIDLNNEIALQPNFPGYALISANDIKMSSKYSSVGNPGLIYAYGQIKFSGLTFIVGGLIAANYFKADGTFGPDANDPAGTNIVDGVEGTMQVTGNTTIITTDFGFSDSSSLISWREVRY